jgi:hypothetical protein
MGRQVRCPHVNPGILQELPDLSPIIGITPSAVDEHDAFPRGATTSLLAHARQRIDGHVRN